VSAPHVEPPVEQGARDGLAYALFAPPGRAAGGVVILHGAGSCKENHADFAQACVSAGLAAVVFDQRGHGASGGALDGRAIEDVAAMASLLPDGPVALRGSSMGGWLSLAAAGAVGAAAVVAVCPASGEQLVRALHEGRFDFAADAASVEPLLAGVDLPAAAAALGDRLLLQHAEGDESVPVAHSRALHAAAPASTLDVVPGGDHRSVQHDRERQARAVAFIAARCAEAAR
jgi:pimeloyl-ACP methyl ester carboxylesterase